MERQATDCPDTARAPRLPPVLDPKHAEEAYQELLSMHLPELSCSGGQPGTCIFHMALERPHLLEIFTVEGILRVTNQIHERTDARDNLEMSDDVSSSGYETGTNSGGEEDGEGGGTGEELELDDDDDEEDDGEGDGEEGEGDENDDGGPAVPVTGPPVAEPPPVVVAAEGSRSGQGPAKRAKKPPKEITSTSQDLRVNLRGPVRAEMLVVGEWLVHHVRAGEGSEGPQATAASSSDWVQDIVQRGVPPSATKFTIMCYTLFSMMAKFRDFADILYSGCCRWRRGEHQFLSAFRTCLETCIRDSDSFSVTAETALLTYTWPCDDLLEVYHSASDPRICISYKLLSIEQQDQRPVDLPGIPWPIHPGDARYPDQLLDKEQMKGMSRIERDALPINGHRGDVMQVTG